MLPPGLKGVKLGEKKKKRKSTLEMMKDRQYCLTESLQAP